MSERVEHYENVFMEVEAESLTVLVVAGASVQEVADVLVADAGIPELAPDDLENSAYVVVEVSGGVLALEHTGYADPHVSVLQRLSAGGRSVAVVRDNIQAHVRFGCARDGALLFDAHEYAYIDESDVSSVPDELRPLFDLAWSDLSDEEPDEEPPSAFAVGVAMAEAFTGIALDEVDFELAATPGAATYPVRWMRYLEPS